ncbi:MAG: relaxase/mobilization nuclease domain-containing protein [Lachnospiraceae bacterium]
MAVSKLWAVSTNLRQVIDYATNPEKTAKKLYSKSDYQALKDVLAYAKNEEKTEKEYFCEGINCNVAIARDQFVSVKEQYAKTDGVQAYHGYLSFKETDITPEFAQKMGMEFAKRVWGKRFQIVVTTHLNTTHLHCHFVINSVSFLDGKKLQNEEKAWFKFRLVADELCREYGLHVIERPERNLSPWFLLQQDNAGLPTRYNQTRWAIDQAIMESRTKEQFRQKLKEMGYTLDYNTKHKYWTIIPKGYEKPIRLYRLGEEYEQHRILERLQENRSKILPKPFQEKTKPEHSYTKFSGLHGLYLHYCYLLGYLPKHKKQNPSKLHYLLRDDLMHLNELTAQVTLLGQHNIQTDEELFAYLQSVEDKIARLESERTKYRNDLKKVGIPDEQQLENKEAIANISKQLQTLRKEAKLCQGIAKRSGSIRAKLEQVLAEEEKTGKERTNHEQQR